MTTSCTQCGASVASWMHHCRSLVWMINLDAYRQFRDELRRGNPLDRLTLGDVIQIEGHDPDEIVRAAEERIEESARAYFDGQLSFRVELHELSGNGFAGNFDYTAIECHGGSEKDLKDVVDFLTSDSAPAPMRLDNDRSYLCKLVSLNSEGRRYVWHSEFLTYDAQWQLSDWNL